MKILTAFLSIGASFTICLLCFGGVLDGDFDPKLVDVPSISAGGWTLSTSSKGPHPTRGGFAVVRRYLRGEDGADLRLVVSKVASPGILEQMRKERRRASGASVPAGTYSEVSLGDANLMHPPEGKSLGQVAYCFPYVVDAMLSYKSTRTALGRIRHDANRPQDIVSMEGMVRHILARLLGSDVTRTTSVTVNGHDYTGFDSNVAGRSFIRLDNWAQARGITFEENVPAKSVSFSKGGKTFLIAMGCKSIRAGTVWKSLGDAVIEKNGKWYVPLEGMQVAVP